MQSFTLSTSFSSLTLFPERGAIITSLKFGEAELLYQDMLKETLFDRTKSVRGGIPILFPNSGAITQEEQNILGYPLGQHGIIRDLSDFEIKEKTQNSLTLTHTNKAEDSPSFPYNFIFEYNIILGENSLELRSNITNTDTRELPIAPGYHPYFPFCEGEHIFLKTQRKDWSEEIMQKKDDWKSGHTLSLDISGEENISIKIGTLSFEYKLDENFTRMMIWSLPGKNFVCVEPVFGKDGMIVKNPIRIQPGETLHYNLKIKSSA